MADIDFSLPEFLKSAEVFTDDIDGDLSDDFQNAALPIYEEMETIMLQYGKESVSNLLPLIVQVFENLDSTQKDNRRYLDTINAMSTDNEHLNNQYEEEKLKRRQKDSDLIKIEEAYDREIIKLKQELDFQIHQCKQFYAKNKSLSENFQRAEERYDILISQISILKTENLHFRQLLQSDQKGKKISSLFIQGFNDSFDVEIGQVLGPPATFNDFSPNIPRNRNTNKRSKQRPSTNEIMDPHENASDGAISETYSSSSEFSPKCREITSSFNTNRYNFRRESRVVSNRKAMGSKIFVFAGMGSGSDQQLDTIPGKKRKTAPDNVVPELSSSNSSNLKTSTHSANDIFTFNNARDYQNKGTLLTDCDSSTSNQQTQPPKCLSSYQKIGEVYDLETDQISGGEVSIEESISIPEEYSPILQENLKLQEEKNKLLTLNNSLESQVNIMHADLEVSELKINDLRQQESQLTEKNISLEAEIKRLKNSISDVREDHRNEPDVFFGFTRTEMAQVLREREQFKERYWALKREYGALEAKRNQKSKIWTFFTNIFKRLPQDDSIRPVSIILNSQISHKTIEDELDEITRNSTRNLFEEDSGPYDCAISLQRATFVPFLRKSVQEEDNRVDAYGWTLPFSTLGESLEDSFRSFSSEGSIPSHIATLYCCRPVSPQEEGAKLWCATPVGEVMGNISHYNSSTTAALFWVCWGVPNLTKVSVVDSTSTEILETFPVCASPLLAISFVPGIPGPSSPLNIEKPTSKLATMWMGGDSGCLYIHSALLAWDKCLYALRLQSSVTDIKYSGAHVFAALTNGTLEIFNRNINGEWDWDNHKSVSIGQRRDFPVLCLLPVNHKIWSGISHTVKILDDTTLKEEHSLQVHYKVTSQVTNMVFYGYGVWLTIRQDSTLRLYNATTYDHLQDLDLAPKLHTLLQLPNNTFPIRITALLVANDSLWIGCDHGAILSIPFCDSSFQNNLINSQAFEEEITTVYPLSSLSLNSNEDTNSTSPKFSSMQFSRISPFCSIDKFQLSFHGHTGPVRFILSASKTVVRSEGFDTIDSQLENFTATSLIVSGGEGHVDYRTSEGAIVGGPDMPLRLKNNIDPTVVVTDRNYFIVWHAKRRNNISPSIIHPKSN